MLKMLNVDGHTFIEGCHYHLAILKELLEMFEKKWLSW